MNGSIKSKIESQPSNVRELDALDRMRKGIEDGKAATKQLADADDYDEKTDSHITLNLTAPNPAPSQSQIEVAQPSPGILTIVFTGVKQLSGGWLAAVLIVAIIAYAWLRSIGAVK